MKFGKLYLFFLKLLSILDVFRKKNYTGKICIVKFDGLGDFILFLDIAKEFKELFPNKKIILFCSNKVKEVAILTKYFDEVVSVFQNEYKLKNHFKLKKKLKKYDCEKILNLATSRDFYSELLVYLIRSKKKYTVFNNNAFSKCQLEFSKKNYDEEIEINLDSMILQQNAQIIKKIGLQQFKSSSPKLNFEYYTHIFIPDDYFILFLGASACYKKWDVKNYIDLSDFIIKKTKLNCVVCGILDDFIMENHSNNCIDKYFNYIDKTSIIDLIFLISKSKFVFGNDTSAIHIASAVGVPSLCISSDSAKERFYPYEADILFGVEPVCIKKEMECGGCSFDKNKFLKCLSNSLNLQRMGCIEIISKQEVEIELEKFLIKIIN